MLDPSLNNAASFADSKGNVPIVIKGGAIKAKMLQMKKNSCKKAVPWHKKCFPCCF